MKEELLEPILRFLRIRTISPYIPENAILCDVGCGVNATFLHNISHKLSRGFGFDKKGIIFSKENLSVDNVDIESQLPLPDASVNCVTLLAVLEHLNDSPRVINECYRIIKPDGVIIITTPAPISKPFLEFLSYKLCIVSPEEIRDHKHYYNKNELRALLTQVGFNGIFVKSFEFGMNNLAIGHKG
jgi:2-polyprenyl-3-methyl-5-hydroxy-6-metoxy-1,4-benzoquinol methylase